MNSIQTWEGAIKESLLGFWYRFLAFVPELIGALIIFFLGLIVAIALGKAVRKIVELIRIDQAFDKIKVEEKLKLTGVKLRISVFCGALVKWFLILVFLMAAANILGLNQVAEFLNKIILYIPNVVVAVVVMVIAFLVGNFIYDVVKSSTRVAGVMSSSFLAAISRWAIVIFGLLAALIQLGIAVSLVQMIFMGMVGAGALAFGLAFGLGGKEEAALILRKIRENMQSK
jgi:MFS family permease